MTSFDDLNAALKDRYSIERELGRGGMATVYLANDIKHDRYVALKTLRPEIAHALGRERFLREIRLAARLQHPNILAVYDSGEADGTLYYIMPYVEGESLRDRLEREPQLPLDEALQITREVAEALSYAHSHDVVHRDIKPENIMLSGGHAMVADFGIARAISAAGGDKLTETGLAIGTPAYMSPEQAAGGTVDRRSDIYSLGCVLYETLAGQPPFTGPTAQAIMARHSLDSVPRLKIVRETIPDDLEAVITRALAKVPADRYQTSGQFAEALTTASTGRVSRVTLETHGRGRSRAAPAWRTPAVVLGALAVIAGVWWFGVRPTRGANLGRGLDAKRVAVAYFADYSSDGSLRHVADGLTEGLIAELGQVRDLDVVSRNGVAPFRGSNVPRDSIARALHAGSLIDGSLEPVGDRVRVVVRLVEGSSGADIDRSTFTIPTGRALAIRDSVVSEVARLLRARLGDEVQLRERRATTASELAWTLVQRAENARKTGDAALARADGAAAQAATHQADSLLGEAQRADPAWPEPLVLRAQVALVRAAALREREERAAIVREGLTYADRAIALSPGDADAIAMLGTLRYALWRLNVESDPAKRDSLLAIAKNDLETAVRLKPSLASAYVTLSSLSYAAKDPYGVVLAARSAYEADAYLREAESVLDRLFWAAYDIGQFTEAQKWCLEGARRFTRNWRFAECQLWLQLVPGAEPDVAAAWRLAATADSLMPPALRPLRQRVQQFVVGGVIGRAGLRDSAEHVFARARTNDPKVDPEQDLQGYEAVMRAQMGDRDGAVAMLRTYVATHPEHSFTRGGTVHWWWRGLEPLPGFQAVLRATK